MTRMKVGFFLPYLQGGGAEKATVLLANSLSPDRFEVDLVCQRIDRVDYVPAPHVNLVDLKSPRALNSVPRLVSYLRKRRPDVLYSVMTHLNILASVALRLSGSPCKHVMSEHNNPHTMRQTEERGGWVERLVPGAYRNATAVLCVSRGVADAMKDFVDASKIVVLPNPVELETIRRGAMEPLEHPWFTGEHPVVLCPARLTEQKGQELLIRAHARVVEHRNANLVLLGDGPDRDDLQRLIAELGLSSHATILPFDPNPYRYMARSTVVALSSRWEGFGMVLVEAMACGVPVVSTNCDFGPREIIRDGVNGRLVPVDDVGRLAEAILDLLENPEIHRRFVLEGARTAQALDLPEVGRQFETLLHEVAPAAPRATLR